MYAEHTHKSMGSDEELAPAASAGSILSQVHPLLMLKVDLCATLCQQRLILPLRPPI